MKQLFTLPILLLAFNAYAFDADDPFVGIRLDWSRYDVTLAMDETTQETRLTHIVLMLNEPFGDWLYGGLRLGYVDVSQTNNPAVAGLSMHGNSLGVRLGAFLMHNDYVDITLQSDYDYLQANDEDTDQKTDFDWTETSLQLAATLKLGQFRLSGAGYRYNINGEQKLHGLINTTTRFSQTESTGISAGIEFQVDPSGYIGIHGEHGAREGTLLTFIREF